MVSGNPDTQCKILFSNKIMNEMIDYSSDEIIGRDISILIPDLIA